MIKVIPRYKLPFKAFLLSSIPLCSFSNTAFLSKNPTSGKNIDRISHMRSLLADAASCAKPGENWDRLWKEGNTPWDLGGPTKVLQGELERSSVNENWKTDGITFRSFVPGCGSAYDLYSIARWQESFHSKCIKRSVVGLDISITSLQRSNQVLSQLLLRPDSDESSPSTGFSTVALYNGDFFSMASDWKLQFLLGNENLSLTPDDQFDFIFDYTFFCALSPELRPQWAKRMSQLLKTDGKLLTLIFPIFPLDSPEMTAMEGPPFPVSIDAYKNALEPNGFQMMVGSPYQSDLTVDRRKGKEMVCWWRKI